MVEKFDWVKTFGKPILGICAGMQTISLVFDVALKGCPLQALQMNRSTRRLMLCLFNKYELLKNKLF
jgi:phosphoribosylformylglycinamidine (FGAM) synthase-like amidotransferase family enzyme